MTWAVFVDLDGTLVDYDNAVRSAIAAFVGSERAWSHVDPGVAASAWLSSRRRQLLDGTTALAAQRTYRMVSVAVAFGISCDERTAARWSRAVTDEAVARCRRYLDVDRFLERAGPLGVVTNGDGSVQRAKLRAAGIEVERFDPFVASMDVGHAKPTAAIYHAAAAASGRSPDQCVMIGDDRRADVAGALAAGFRNAVLVDRSIQPAADSVPSLIQALDALRTATGSREDT